MNIEISNEPSSQILIRDEGYDMVVAGRNSEMYLLSLFDAGNG
jgi:hypothetical protein